MRRDVGENLEDMPISFQHHRSHIEYAPGLDCIVAAQAKVQRNSSRSPNPTLGNVVPSNVA
jgi:hypothetical protein